MNYLDVAPDCPTVTQRFGCTDFPEWYRPSCPPPHYWHDGIDWAGPNCCGTPMLSCGEGEVRAIGQTWPGSDGLGPGAILILMPDGVWAGYGHGRAQVAVGQRVRKGERIGSIDTLGNSTGCHLHLLLGRNYGSVPLGSIDPLTYTGPGGDDLTPEEHTWLHQVHQFDVGTGNQTFYNGKSVLEWVGGTGDEIYYMVKQLVDATQRLQARLDALQARIEAGE